ncbi:HhoA/HhoB/HtrA family serine endopeptidase [Candidatus Atelocyanobacterium thalassae]|uniref:Trypsin-like serine protease with C-terminal PDZ domain n=1 Tax=Atelocyanobacterium thalassa (isolate ALOHA) TaxID=1453429 RepID=D3ENW8_ATETH|nr:HhoA/HhoB/HtrA family serine endopeptidase [Candidatus Atelocyanobacterium thalassa]ADB95168.1 trypsin-like serine protease with C-terminal PDZ domain [Candidatus Atelocyanobacterium thalassa isolate ALOHA]MCH2543175.1 trypsin-like peptidase domain-containing protein [Candidatus Atelocyanobacterium sp. ALOHA_A2.5_9]|tara:strand:+ start:35829 stop:36953 length:1125 start_codon:yes stop_codon:yes gene_type:complete
MIFCVFGFYNSVSQAESINHVLEKPPSSYDNTGANNFVSAAVIRTGPAVVRIDTETVVTRQLNPFFDDPLFRDFFGQQLRPRIPQERRITGQGSGFIIDKSGIILTNAHVVSNADKVTVTLKDGRTFNGKVKGTDEVTDLAVVGIDTKGNMIPVAKLGDSDNLKVGNWAIAVGNPVGLDNTVTLGIISTIGRSAAQAGIPDKRLDFIQTDAAINPGNSGGPLLNGLGEVIGINTAIRADAMGIGFAIPINKAKALQKALVSGQQVPHPYIGVQMVNITPEIARENNRNPNSPIIIAEVEGILVIQVVPDSPAAKAKLRRGDVIIAVNNQPVKDGGDLQKIVEETGINTNLKLKLYRGDRLMELTVKTKQLKGTS